MRRVAARMSSTWTMLMRERALSVPPAEEPTPVVQPDGRLALWLCTRAGARCVGMSSSLVDAAEGFTLGAWSAFFAAGREPCCAVRAAAPLDTPPAAPACVAPAAGGLAQLSAASSSLRRPSC